MSSFTMECLDKDWYLVVVFVNNTYKVLAVFMVRRLARHHSENFASSELALLMMSVELSACMYSVESSANCIVFRDVETLLISFIYIAEKV